MAKRKDKNEIVKHTKEMHSLPVKLTTEEIAKAAEDLASALQELEGIEVEKKAVMKDYNSQIETRKKRIHRLMTHVKNGVEYRPVECDLQFHISKVLAILVRNDSGEIVEERPMSDEEKQMQIEFAEEEDQNDKAEQKKIEFDEDNYKVNDAGVVENPSILEVKLPKNYGTKIIIKWAKLGGQTLIGVDIVNRKAGLSSPCSTGAEKEAGFKTFTDALNYIQDKICAFVKENKFENYKQIQTKVIKTIENYMEGIKS